MINLLFELGSENLHTSTIIDADASATSAKFQSLVLVEILHTTVIREFYTNTTTI